MRNVRKFAHDFARCVSWLTPWAPNSWIARSTTSSAMAGTVNCDGAVSFSHYSKQTQRAYLRNTNLLQRAFGLELVDLFGWTCSHGVYRGVAR
jgi:hypothetical protein